MKWNLKKIKVSELKEFENNPRVITKKGLADLKQSILKFGIAEPIVLNTDLTICGGHGRLKVLKDIGILEVDCYIPEVQLNENEFKELNIRLNKNIAGEFDFDILANYFETKDLIEWGFDEAQFGLGEDFEPQNDDTRLDIERLNLKDVTCPKCNEKFQV